jgi:hypothetical protein
MAEPLIDSLSNLATRFRLERERVLDKAVDLNERIRAHVARIDYRLDLVSRLIEELARTYTDSQLYARAVYIDLHRVAQERGELSTPSLEPVAREPPEPAPDRSRLEELAPKAEDRGLGYGITMAQIEATEIPPILNGHQLRPSFKKARVIRATKALLLREGWATSLEILEFLAKMSVTEYNQKSLRNVSTILANASEIFGTYIPKPDLSPGWYIIEAEEVDSEIDSPKRRPP